MSKTARLPKMEHEYILSGITDTPYSCDVMNTAIDEVQELLVTHYNWPKNVMICGLMYQALWKVYCAGEQRGVAREQCPASALFPIPDLKGVG